MVQNDTGTGGYSENVQFPLEFIHNLHLPIVFPVQLYRMKWREFTMKPNKIFPFILMVILTLALILACNASSELTAGEEVPPTEPPPPTEAPEPTEVDEPAGRTSPESTIHWNRRLFLPAAIRRPERDGAAGSQRSAGE